MKAKLIKNSAGEYHLIVDKCPDFVSISEPITNWFVIASEHNVEMDFLKLSLKNCQAIERGYDLDELADEIDNSKIRYSSDEHEEWKAYRNGLNDALEKALEILGGKKFKEEDMRKALHRMATSFMKGYNFDNDVDFQEADKIIQSLQQNEWEVEFEMEEVDVQFDRAATSLSDYDHFTVTRKPKLDADGRLILKRVI